MSLLAHFSALALALLTWVGTAPVQHVAAQQTQTQAKAQPQAQPQAQPATLATAAVPAPAARPSNLRADLSTKWFDATGNIVWPPNDGFTGKPVEIILPPGTLLDRYGSEGGRFFSPANASYDGRALPYAQDKMPYTVYRLEAPLKVQAGTAAAWFDEPGGAVQYKTDEPVFRLRASGTLVPVTPQ